MEPEQTGVLTSRSVDGRDDDQQELASAEDTSLTQAACHCSDTPLSATDNEQAWEAAHAETGGGPGYVYALGQIQVQFPSLGVEKEFAQVVGRAEPPDLTDDEALYRVLSDPDNRYLVRQLCFILSVQGVETYILRPRDSAGYDLLVEAIRPVGSPWDLDVVIGRRGPVAPPELCNGLTVPVVVFEQIYSFDSGELIRAVERPDEIPAKDFETASRKLLDRLLQIGDNSGTTDEHRAINYAAVRNEKIYQQTIREYARGFRLSAVDVYPSRLSGSRKILDIVFSYTSRKTDVTEKSFLRIDVTEMFPFTRTNWSPYYDR
ncbi:cyanobactin maturation protease PatG family protein [Streptomyces phaeoluteigriseus]